jgi:hypothetical protein
MNIEHRRNYYGQGKTEIRSLKIFLTIQKAAKALYTRGNMSSNLGAVLFITDFWFPPHRKPNQLTFSGKYSVSEGGIPHRYAV